MKRISVIIMLLYCFVYGCKTGSNNIVYTKKITVDTDMLDSIKAKADTVYSKKYTRTDFVSAEYYINYKDSTTTQVMKDNEGTIRQIIIEKNKRRRYIAQFYPNGQMVAKYGLDDFGQYNDSSKEFFENGILKSDGFYKNGFHFGKWKNYDSTGKYLNTDEYNNDGQKIKTTE